MKQEQKSRIRIIADEGMMLYNGEVLGKEVYLGSQDSVENWRQISDAEAALLQEEELL